MVLAFSSRLLTCWGRFLHRCLFARYHGRNQEKFMRSTWWLEWVSNFSLMGKVKIMVAEPRKEYQQRLEYLGGSRLSHVNLLRLKYIVCMKKKYDEMSSQRR